LTFQNKTFAQNLMKEEEEWGAGGLMVEQMLERLELNVEQALVVYLVGSRAWGTATERSDFDFVIVMDENYYTPQGAVQLQRPGIDAAVYNVIAFEKGLDEHNCFLLACLSLPPENVWLQKRTFETNISPYKLRTAVSAEASRTWCKAKKKNLEENNPALSKKDVIHCLRELKFGIQLAKYGHIRNFGTANKYVHEMASDTSVDWNEYGKKWQVTYNKLSSKLKKAVAKDPYAPVWIGRREHLRNPASPEEMEEWKAKGYVWQQERSWH